LHELTGAELKVFNAIAYHWQRDDWLAYPSAETIAKFTGFSKRYVKAVRKKLVNDGWLEQIEAGGGRGKSPKLAPGNREPLLFTLSGRKTGSASGQKGEHSAGKRVNDSGKTVNPSSSPEHRNTYTESSSREDAAADHRASIERELIAAGINGSKRQALTEAFADVADGPQRIRRLRQQQPDHKGTGALIGDLEAEAERAHQQAEATAQAQQRAKDRRHQQQAEQSRAEAERAADAALVRSLTPDQVEQYRQQAIEQCPAMRARYEQADPATHPMLRHTIAQQARQDGLSENDT
jgi:hypothetical protein